ncbi:hypothetical protein OQJ13_06185 [Legionella sp. PATHC035]|uniref:hypothetical protein n=1 Tax=Legionella sp. PATHC035 TaxID=2992040 RepID=UPI002243F26A|nr:hypothetical protein [Legionella sp. PATHC035]MCW8408560.1 hypothetical protein [Legionella sp. PATHC035]
MAIFFWPFFSPEIPPGVDVTFDPTLRVFGPRENKNAKYKNFGQSISIDESSERQLIPILVNIQLLSKFGEKNTKKVQGELNKISAGFKKNNQHPSFSKVTTECINCPFCVNDRKIRFP